MPYKLEQYPGPGPAFSTMLVLDSETKGAVKYREQLPSGRLADYPNSPGAKIGVLYIRKSAFTSTPYPGVIGVTIMNITDTDGQAVAS